MVTDVMAAGVEIEISLVMLLGLLSGSDPQAAALVLRQMRSVADQEKAVLNVAKARLPPEDFDITKIATKAIEAHRKRRNRFAHNPWACSPDELPGAIFLIETSALSHYLAGISSHIPSERAGLAPFEIQDDDVYRAPEIRRAREEARDAAAVMRLLVGYLTKRYRRDLVRGDAGIDAALAELRAVTPFADAENEFRARVSKRRQG